MNRFFYVSCFIAVLVVSAPHQAAAQVTGYGVGDVAPNFHGIDQTGQPVSLKDFQGEFVVLDYSAVWCAPCNGEMSLGLPASAIAPVTDQGIPVHIQNLQVLLQNASLQQAVLADVQRWAKKYNPNFPVLYAPTGGAYKTANNQFLAYATTYPGFPSPDGFFPLKVIIGPDGLIVGFPAVSDSNDIVTESQEVTAILQMSFQYNPVYQLYETIAFLQQSPLTNKQIKPLLQTLNNSLEATQLALSLPPDETAGEVGIACELLTTFRGQVNALPGKYLPTVQTLLAKTTETSSIVCNI
jgi:thiol-disulfide isomerase/thioredoxin